eukprot:3551628-Pyramimonas_sp.AAC.1
MCIVKYEDDKYHCPSHLDIMFRFSVDSPFYHMSFNPHSPWAQQLPDACGHNYFILTMMRNIDRKDDGELVLFHWVPHFFATIQDDATKRLVETSPSDILKFHSAFESLFALWAKDVLTNPKCDEYLGDPMKDNIKADAIPTPSGALGPDADPGGTASAGAPTREEMLTGLRAYFDDNLQ